MPFQPGNPGRPKGAISRRAREVQELAEQLDINPIEILLRFAQGDWEGLGYAKGTKTIYTEAGAVEEDLITPGERIQAAKEVAQYIYPKLKSVEHSTDNSISRMSSEQKLEAMRQAVRLLEAELTPQERAVQEKE